jgi:Tfp pilus assembly protein PilV
MDGTRRSSASNIRRIAARLRSQRGFALPTTMLMLIAAFGVVSVGVVAAIGAQKGTVRDQSTKSAVQLAETGSTRRCFISTGSRPAPPTPAAP